MRRRDHARSDSLDILPPFAMPHRAIARAFLAGDPVLDQVIERATRTLGKTYRWLPRVARLFLKTFPPGQTRPRERDVIRLLLKDRGVQRSLRKLSIEQWLNDQHVMRPSAAAVEWKIPPIESVGALAEWLQLSIGQLEWFADLRDLNRKGNQPLAHYRYRVLTKSSGGVRLIEAPKPRLKQLQRKILVEILEKVPSHPAVHGFLKGHSIKTFATPHVGKRVVLRIDLEDFFPSISRARVQALFRTMGYPEAVADLLGGICTTVAPRQYSRGAEELYFRPHLPQGAPTSPALANLCAYRFDCRLSAFAKSAGAVYTRYADDLAFSGDGEFKRCVERFSIHAASIVNKEGFQVQHRKTRIMRHSVRQHLAGLVTNEKINVRRSEFDRIKATLTNCVRSGQASQNREAHPHFRLHLEGKVSFVESINEMKGKRLRTIFEQIAWQ